MLLMSAGDAVIGEHHLVKWPIARIVAVQRTSRSKKEEESLDFRTGKGEVLIRYKITKSGITNSTWC